MIYCLTCKRLVPPGKYCPLCQGAWGAAVCGDCGHRNAPGVPACVMCTKIALSDATFGVNLGCVPVGLSALLLVGLLRLLLGNPGGVAQGLDAAVTWGAGALLGWEPVLVRHRTWEGLTFLFVVLPLVGFLMGGLPDRGGPLGDFLRNLPWRVLTWLWQGVVFLAPRIVAGVGRLFFGRPGGKP